VVLALFKTPAAPNAHSKKETEMGEQLMFLKSAWEQVDVTELLT
jgi:hypothetical protein